MEIPKNAKTCVLRGSTMWKNEEGIVFSSPNPDALLDQTNEEIKEEMKMIREFVGNKKVCLVAVSNPKQKPVKKEHRDFIASEINSIFKAMAIITSSPVSRMMANLFFSFKPPTYPVKMFTTEKEATDWIRQYL